MTGGVESPPRAGLADVLVAACAALERRAREIDDLNVFPVADGDTGANMVVTARATAAAARDAGGRPAAERADAVARAALVAARGNSGMILSQVVRGAATAVAEVALLDGAAVARAARAASDAAEGAVREPVEGTMLTVARLVAEAAEAAAHGAGLEEVLDAAVDAAHRGVAETTAQMDRLREAGVVDSGALGLAVLLDGLAAAVAGRPPPEAPAAPVGAVAVEAVHAPSRYRYCTSFLVEDLHDEGRAGGLGALEAALADLGDSLLVLGDARRAKVHLHTDTPERAVERAGGLGHVEGVAVEDMRRQEAERAARLRRRAAGGLCGALCLAEGAGVAALLEGLGATVPARGDDDLDVALTGLGTAEAVILPTDPTRLAAARAAAAGFDGVAAVVEAASLPAALAALVGFDPRRGAEENREEMASLGAGVRSAGVEGADAVALAAALAEALDRLGPGTLVTVIIGAGAPVTPAEAEAWVRQRRPGAEVEAHEGGQPAPALAVGVE